MVKFGNNEGAGEERGMPKLVAGAPAMTPPAAVGLLVAAATADEMTCGPWVVLMMRACC